MMMTFQQWLNTTLEIRLQRHNEPRLRCDHRYVAYGLALKEETNLSILSTTASTIVLTSKPDIAISDSNKTSQTMADEQTTNYKDADSAVLVASVFLIYIVFFPDIAAEVENGRKEEQTISHCNENKYEPQMKNMTDSPPDFKPDHYLILYLG
uniref:Uncharacterized protein n=1 Tax=Magallana gigas TaxID=29159 RepID=K1RK70_MAGGI